MDYYRQIFEGVIFFTVFFSFYVFIRQNLYIIWLNDKDFLERSEVTQLKSYYLDRLEELTLRLDDAERVRCDVSEFAHKMQKCLKIAPGDKITMTTDECIICQPHEIFLDFEVFMVKKGSYFKVLREKGVIRHGISYCRCIYAEMEQETTCEDNVIARKSHKFLEHKSKVYISETDIVRLKTLNMLYKNKEDAEIRKLRRLKAID